MGDTITKLALSKIRTDGGTQPRAEIDSDTVEQYRERMEEGDKFPPIIVFYDGRNYWLADGFHRHAAASAADWKDIEAKVRQGSQREAQWFSFGANKGHGKQRTRGDVRRAVERILDDPEWSKTPGSKIAEHIGTSAGYVSDIASIRKRIDAPEETRTVTRNGKTFEMNTANIGRKSSEPSSPPTPEQVRENHEFLDRMGMGVPEPKEPVTRKAAEPDQFEGGAVTCLERTNVRHTATAPANSMVTLIGNANRAMDRLRDLLAEPAPYLPDLRESYKQTRAAVVRVFAEID